MSTPEILELTNEIIANGVKIRSMAHGKDFKISTPDRQKVGIIALRILRGLDIEEGGLPGYLEHLFDHIDNPRVGEITINPIKLSLGHEEGDPEKGFELLAQVAHAQGAENEYIGKLKRAVEHAFNPDNNNNFKLPLST